MKKRQSEPLSFFYHLRPITLHSSSLVLIFEIKATSTFLIFFQGAVLVTKLGLVGEKDVEFLGEKDIPFVVLNYGKTKEFVYLALFEIGVKIQVWSKTGKGDYVKTVEGSPANATGLEEYFGLDDIFSNNLDATSVNSSYNSHSLGSSIAVRFVQEDGQLKFGAAFFEFGDNTFLIGEFYEDESFSLLESILVSLQANEVDHPLWFRHVVTLTQYFRFFTVLPIFKKRKCGN